MPQVVVGCKLPSGLVMEKNGIRVELKGANSSLIIGGHGITEGVDKDFFDTWMKEHEEIEFVRQGFIFAHEKEKNTSAEAKDRAKQKTGFERIDPSKSIEVRAL